MIISDFTADISTLNFGTDKETQVVHDTLHAKGVTTIGELCHLSKKHIEALGLDPSLIELHLKKMVCRLACVIMNSYNTKE